MRLPSCLDSTTQRTRIRIIAVLSAAALLLAGSAALLHGGQKKLDSQLNVQLDAIFSPLADSKSPGLAVLVRKNGQTVFERAYGARELRTFAAIDPSTNFRLASCTKQFTAMAIMLLVHDGKLTYDRT